MLLCICRSPLYVHQKRLSTLLCYRYSYICPTWWSLSGITTTQLGNVQETMTLDSGGTVCFSCWFLCDLCLPLLHEEVPQLYVGRCLSNVVSVKRVALQAAHRPASSAAILPVQLTALHAAHIDTRSLVLQTTVQAYVEDRFGFAYNMRGCVAALRTHLHAIDTCFAKSERGLPN